MKNKPGRAVDRAVDRREETRRNIFFFNFGDAFAKLPALIGYKKSHVCRCALETSS